MRVYEGLYKKRGIPLWKGCPSCHSICKLMIESGIGGDGKRRYKKSPSLLFTRKLGLPPSISSGYLILTFLLVTLLLSIYHLSHSHFDNFRLTLNCSISTENIEYCQGLRLKKVSFMRCFFLLLPLVISLHGSLGAEILRFPPVILDPVFTSDGEFLSGVLSWFDFHHYVDNGGNDNFSQDSDLGVLFTLFSNENISVQAIAREIIQNQVNYDVSTSLGFYLRALLSDLRLILTVRASPFYFSWGYRHDCKHDIDMFSGRNAVHDTLFFRIASKKFSYQWPVREIFSEVSGSILGEINLPYIFQQIKPEPDKSRLSLVLKCIPIGCRDFGSLFVGGEFSIIRRNKSGTEISRVIDPAYDWHLQVGSRIRGKYGNISLYCQIERITDPWVNNNPVPVFLQAVGIVISISG